MEKIMIRRISLALLMIMMLCAMTGCNTKSASYGTTSGATRTIKVNNIKKELTLGNVRFLDKITNKNRYLNGKYALITQLSANTTEVTFSKNGNIFTAKISPSASKLKVYYNDDKTYDTYKKK